MVSAEDAITLLRRLSSEGIPVWLTGGWGIDALLGEQTRPHKDLDVLVRLDDVVRLRELLAREGYGLAELWSENAFVTDGSGTETPTAFVLEDEAGRQLDVHALRLDEDGTGVPAWNSDEGRLFRPEDLGGRGEIGGLAVRCLSAAMQVTCHEGYVRPDYQVQDLARLQERFGVSDAVPDDAGSP